MKYFLFIYCFSFLTYQSIYLFSEFVSGKTVINISFGLIRNTTLPSVTICPHFLDFRKLAMLNKNVSILYNQYLKMIENASRSNIDNKGVNSYLLYIKALKIFFNSNAPNINIKNDILENVTPLTKNETMFSVLFHQAMAYGDIDQDLIRIGEYYFLTSLPMESLSIVIAENIPYVHKCYTLFSQSELSWKNIKMDLIKFDLNLALSPYSYPISLFMYILIYIHSPNALPSENFNAINPGYYYTMGYSKLTIKRLGKGYDTDCREYNHEVYTRSDCIFDCYQEKVKYHCQTEDYVGSILLKRKTYFEQRNLNLSKFHLEKKIHYEVIKTCDEQCYKDCDFTYYSTTVNKFKEIDLYQAVLSFSHNEMPDITIRHIPEMPLLTFICNFGGILGMWLGVSFFGTFEIIWKLIRVNILSKISIIQIINNNDNKFFISTKTNSRNAILLRNMTS